MAFTPAAYPQGTDVWLPDEAEVWVKAVAFEQTPEHCNLPAPGRRLRRRQGTRAPAAAVPVAVPSTCLIWRLRSYQSSSSIGFWCYEDSGSLRRIHRHETVLLFYC